MHKRNPTNDRTLFARVALVLLVAGLLGYLALDAFDHEIFGKIVLAVAGLPALIMGWVGRSRLPGKIAVGGVCLIVGWFIDVSLTREVEPDPRPAFALNATKPFVVELGRGSGLYGLDIVKVSETGEVELYRIAGGGKVVTASLRLPAAAVKELVDLVNSRHLTSMGRSYSDPGIRDGTQWVLWIQQAPSEKAIYFNNSFPSKITGFADRLDALLQNAGAARASWSPAPKQQAADEQTALWARIEPAK